MKMRRGIAVVLALVLGAGALADATVRVATYNIKFLSTEVGTQGDRLDKLRTVVAALDADIVGLQEIDDRAALALLFDPAEWSLVIDDDSGLRQDLAVAVRRPLVPVDVPADLDADDAQFLFPDEADDAAFPARRDVLAVAVRVPGAARELSVLVVHAKSRFGGRSATDARRELAARMLVQRLERDYDERDFVLLGDFNDNPDDRSLNILETGDPDAPGGREDLPGAFLVNLTEPFCARDEVSHGLRSNAIDAATGRIDVVSPDSRRLNDVSRGMDAFHEDVLFDQILVPARLAGRCVPGSVAILDDPAAVLGNDETRASDHLPVRADLSLAGEVAIAGGTVVIAAVLPDPEGADARHEQVVLRNLTAATVDLAGWRLVDRADNTFALGDTIGAGQDLTILLSPHTLPLNNGGDRVQLLDAGGTERDRITYDAAAVGPGRWIHLR